MTRAQFQVLIIPYRIASGGQPEYAIAKRSDMDAWQFFSGGGEENEAPIQAARREANEEGGIPVDLEFVQLDSIASIPAHILQLTRNGAKMSTLFRNTHFTLMLEHPICLLVANIQKSCGDSTRRLIGCLLGIATGQHYGKSISV